jgi:hypothetical protein
MTVSEDHRGSRRLVDLSEVSHARVAIISALSCAPTGVTVPDTAAGLPAALGALAGQEDRLGRVLAAATGSKPV